MKACTNCWWYIDGYDELGNPIYGDFTFVEFNGLLLMHEGSSIDIYEELDAIVAAQQLYVGGNKDPYCPSGPCRNGAYNFWAAFSEVAHTTLISPYVRLDKDITTYYGPGNAALLDPVGVMNRAAELGSMMIYPKNLDYQRNNALSNFGNNKEVVEKLLKTDIKPDTFYPGGNNGFYYYTEDGYGIWYAVTYSIPDPK